MAVVSFDFDGVLSDTRIQALAKKLVREGNEVWIVTARRDNKFNKELITKVSDKIGISEYRIIYSDEKPKFELLIGINADIYIDNISDEFENIKNHSNIIPLLW